MKLKVCGMKLNTREVAELRPNYLGFIFWKNSPRFFDKEMPTLPPEIQKVGVFVDASVDDILDRIDRYDLQAVQLHGSESPEFCRQLQIELKIDQAGTANIRSSASTEFPMSEARLFGTGAVEDFQPRAAENVRSSAVETSSNPIKIIKVFSIKDHFDFGILKSYENSCDYFLFDTKGELPGGNGYAFDWSVLKSYPSNKPFFLSGGIGLEETESIQKFMQRPESKYCHAIDVNSRFEIEPGLKDLRKLRKFKSTIEL